MLFDVKIRPFVSATFHRSRCEFAPVANVAAIGRPKMAYRDVEKIHQNKSSQRICFIWQLICMTMFVSLEVGNVSAQ